MGVRLTSDPSLDRPARRSVSRHERRIDPRDTLVEMVGFRYGHAELGRPILQRNATGYPRNIFITIDHHI